MTVSNKAAEWAEGIAADNSHGYDQGSRWGPDYDCSSLVISAYKAAGVPLQSTYTGNMWQDFLNHGFQVVKDVNLATGAGLQRGDVLLNVQHHTAMAIGGGRIVQASGNEWGGATGGQTGDQTGAEIHVRSYYNFPWDCVLRYVEEDDTPHLAPPAPPSPQGEGTYTVQSGDTLWGIAERFLGSGSMYVLLMTANHLNDSMIWPGQVLIIPGKGEGTETITATVKASTARALRRLAEANGKTVGECIDDMF